MTVGGAKKVEDCGPASGCAGIIDFGRFGHDAATHRTRHVAGRVSFLKTFGAHVVITRTKAIVAHSKAHGAFNAIDFCFN